MNDRKLMCLSLPERIAATLRREIIDFLEPGQRLETEPVLAKRFDCSIGSLRSAVKLLEEDDLVERRQGVGTFVSSQVEKPVAILVDHDIAQWGFSYFYRKIMSSLIRYFDQARISHRFYLGSRQFHGEETTLSCRSFLHDLSHNKFAGVIEACTTADESWMGELRRKEVPLVGVYSVDNTISPDIEAAILRGAEALRDQGCRSIAMFFWGVRRDTWMQGVFFEAMLKLGLNPRRCLFLDTQHMKEGKGRSMAADLKQMIKKRDGCDGLLFADEFLLQEIALPLIGLGIDIPGEVKIASVSYKGLGVDLPFPLTRMQFDPEEIARKMGAMLLDLVHRREVESTKVLIEPEIIASA